MPCIHICVAIYSICAALERNSLLLQEVGLESPPGLINCLLPLKGMRGADVIGHYRSLTPPVLPVNNVRYWSTSPGLRMSFINENTCWTHSCICTLNLQPVSWEKKDYFMPHCLPLLCEEYSKKKSYLALSTLKGSLQIVFLFTIHDCVMGGRDRRGFPQRCHGVVF